MQERHAIFARPNFGSCYSVKKNMILPKWLFILIPLFLIRRVSATKGTEEAKNMLEVEETSKVSLKLNRTSTHLINIYIFFY